MHKGHQSGPSPSHLGIAERTYLMCGNKYIIITIAVARHKAGVMLLLFPSATDMAIGSGISGGNVPGN